jgi:hypothetical protein
MIWNPSVQAPTTAASDASTTRSRGVLQRDTRMRGTALLALAGSFLLGGCALTPLGVNPGWGACSGSSLCVQYLTTLRDHVDGYWIPDPRGPLGKVKVSFRLDSAGHVEHVEVADADSSVLADGVLFAFRAAMPLQPPPPELVDRELELTFRHTPPPFNRARLSIVPAI